MKLTAKPVTATYYVKAPGLAMVLLHPTPLGYEDARRLASKLGGIVTNASFVKRHNLQMILPAGRAVA